MTTTRQQALTTWHIIRVNNYLIQEHDTLTRHIHSHLADIKPETLNHLIRKNKGYHKTTLAITKNKPPNETNSTHLDQLKDLVSIPTVNKLQLVN